MEFRCAERLHFKLIGDIAEVKCKSKRCGAGRGNVILHRFNIRTGNLVETLEFKDPKAMVTSDSLSEQAETSPTTVLFSEAPNTTDKEKAHGSRTAHCAAGRSA
jgi:hypothetical protein